MDFVERVPSRKWQLHDIRPRPPRNREHAMVGQQLATALHNEETR